MQRRLHGSELGLVKNFSTVSVKSHLCDICAAIVGGGVLSGVFCHREGQRVRISFCTAAECI